MCLEREQKLGSAAECGLVGWGYKRWVGDTRGEQTHEGISVMGHRQSLGVEKNRGWESRNREYNA